MFLFSVFCISVFLDSSNNPCSLELVYYTVCDTIFHSNYVILLEGEIAAHYPLEGVLELLVGGRVAERVQRTETQQ